MAESKNEIRHRFVECADRIVADESADVSDWDEIQIIAEAAKGILPRRVIELVTQSSPQSSERRRFAAQRARRMLSVYESMPKTGSLIEESAVQSHDLIPVFELDTSDRKRISELCGQMRKIVLASDAFDQPHRVRLLNRIAAIETETEKPLGIFDVVRGGMNDLGETLGKFGTDVKPLTDRMKEVVSIARKGSKQYEQLPEPEDVKKLPAPESGTLDDSAK